MSYVCFSPTFSTYAQAVSHLTKGLELLKTLPETPERNQHELVMQASLGHSLMTSKGYAGAEVEQAYTRARGLCGPVGETSQIFPVLWGLWAFYVVRAELQMALELGEQLLSLAQSEQDQALLLEAHHALGVSLFWLGDMAPARAHLEQGIALYVSKQHRSHHRVQDPGVTCLSNAALALWQRQSKRDEARQMLADIYEWFTEGFDTTDLKEARALFEELS